MTSVVESKVEPAPFGSENMSEAEERTFKNTEDADACGEDCIEEIEVEDMTVDGICGVY
jgi:hypothetical protein